MLFAANNPVFLLVVLGFNFVPLALISCFWDAVITI